MSTSSIAELFQRIPFQRLTQLELLDDMRVRAPDIVQLRNHFGTVHGGMLYALGEVAAAAAVAQLLQADSGQLFAITRRGNIDYLKPARGVITAHGEVALSLAQILEALEHQRSLDVQVAVTLSDQADITVAKLDFTWYVARARSSK